MIKINQEELELKEFVLDANLYLIANSLHMLLASGGFLYYFICYFYSNEQIGTVAFISATVFFISFIGFALLSIRSIAREKKYIERLSALYEKSI